MELGFWIFIGFFLGYHYGKKDYKDDLERERREHNEKYYGKSPRS